jgi:putative MATE family efflux protein
MRKSPAVHVAEATVLFKIEDKNLFKHMLTLALPIMGSNLLQTLYNLADTYFLGKLGSEALSAPSVSFSIIFFMIIFGSGFSMAGTTLISQAKGKGDLDRVDFYVSQTFGILVLTSFVIMAAGLVGTPAILRAMQVPEEIFDVVALYLKIIFLGMPFMFMSFVLRATLQGIGDSVTPLKIQIVTVVLNIILDPLLIFGIGPFPMLGVAGAAIATVISRAVNMFLAFYILFSGKKGIRIRRRYLKPTKEAWSLIMRIGLPSAFGGGLSALGFSVLQGVVNTFGAPVIAAFGVGNRIIGLFNMPAQGISQATAVLVGQSLGARDERSAERVVKYGSISIFVFVTLGMSMTFFFGNRVTTFFISDPEVIAYGTQLFRIVSLSVIFFCLFTVVNGAFQGGGDTKPIMIFNIVRLWGVRVPLALLLAKVMGMGPEGIWWAMFASNVVVAAGNALLYRTGRWKYRLSPDSI